MCMFLKSCLQNAGFYWNKNNWNNLIHQGINVELPDKETVGNRGKRSGESPCSNILNLLC